MTVIGSGNVRVPFLNPTTSGLACSLQGARGSEGVNSVGVLASSQADYLITCVKLSACDWAAARGSTLPHIATLPPVTLEWLRNMSIPLDEMANILQVPFLNEFSWMESFVCWFKFCRGLFLSVHRMAWQWAETLVEIRGTLADIRGTTK